MDEKRAYIPTIGLEIHAELRTASKMFCSCKNDPDEARPNANICPICVGHPGTLPILNREAIRSVLKVGLAVGGVLSDFTEWDRKSYFYPDIPKGYQISQYRYPLVSGGKLTGVDLERIHLEEDTAQSTHDTHENSLINFNRSGVPLMELVTKPVIHDAATAVHFAKELQLLLRTLGAGEANLEKGEMRVEANISVASPEDTSAGKFGTKTEVKNLNSFRSVENAIACEIERQTSLLERGEKVSQETRGWDEHAAETFSQRSKESSHDYRYFPDADIPKLKLSEISEFSSASLSKELPELPWVKRSRFKETFGMTDKEVAVFLESPLLSKYFESVITSFRENTELIRLTTNYILTDYVKLLKDGNKNNSEFASLVMTIKPEAFSELMTMIADGDISSRGAKNILALLFGSQGASPRVLAREHGLIQKSDPAALSTIVESIIRDHAPAITEYKAGKIASLQFLIGQGMKASKGSANPELLKKLFLERLGEPKP